MLKIIRQIKIYSLRRRITPLATDKVNERGIIVMSSNEIYARSVEVGAITYIL